MLGTIRSVLQKKRKWYLL